VEDNKKLKKAKKEKQGGPENDERKQGKPLKIAPGWQTPGHPRTPRAQFYILNHQREYPKITERHQMIGPTVSWARRVN